MEKDKIAGISKMLVIGGSAGSLDVLLKILPNFKYDISFPVIIVMHRKNSSDSALSELLATRTKIPVYEIEDKQKIEAGQIYIAPADYHLLFEKDLSFSLDFSEKVNYSRPSIDVSFESAADVYGAGLTCILLSGASADGAKGLKVVKESGGTIAVQDPDTADSPFMPRQALLYNEVDNILRTEVMAQFINLLGG